MMKSHSELMAMPDADRMAYLAQEVEWLIRSAPAHNQLNLRALQAQCDGIRRRVKSPLVAARMMFDRMQGKFDELRRAVNGLPNQHLWWS